MYELNILFNFSFNGKSNKYKYIETIPHNYKSSFSSKYYYK